MTVKRWPYKALRLIRGGSQTENLNDLFMELAPAYRNGPFLSREDFVARMDGGNGRFFPDVGSRVQAGGVEYVYDGVSTEILDLPGFKPAGVYTPQHFGSPGDIKERTNSRVYGYLLSDRYETLALAQAVYPKATALTETIDSHAMQRMVDAVRGKDGYTSSGPVGAFRVDGGPFWNFHFPHGSQYVINRTVDFTGLVAAQVDFWYLTGDGAVIFNQCIGEAGFDFLASNAMYAHGWTMVNELIRGEGCPRTGVLIGRDSSGAPAGNHHFDRTVLIKGYATLSAMHVYASEETAFALTLVNDLNPNECMADYDTASGTISAGDTLTWTGSGAGTVVDINTTDGVIGILVTAGTLSDDTQVTTGGAVTFYVRDVYYQPNGEDSDNDNRSYGITLDGTNKWGTASQYRTNAASPDSASFIDNNFVDSSFRHRGHGGAIWLDAHAQNFNFSDSYQVTYDNDWAAVTIYFGSAGNVGNNFTFNNFDTETDGADSDDSTGQGYEFMLQSITARPVFLDNFTLQRNTPKFSYAHIKAGTNVNAVHLRGLDYKMAGRGTDTDQTMFDDPSIFYVTGSVAVIKDPNGGAFLNLADWGSFRGTITCEDVYDENVRADTSFLVQSPDDMAFMHKLTILSTGSAGSGLVEARDTSGTLLSYIDLDNGNVYFDGDKVLGTRQAAVDNLAVTYTSGSAPSATGSFTIANGASVTNAELHRYVVELDTKLKAACARMRAHGLIES